MPTGTCTKVHQKTSSIFTVAQPTQDKNQQKKKVITQMSIYNRKYKIAKKKKI